MNECYAANSFRNKTKQCLKMELKITLHCKFKRPAIISCLTQP